jgi:hypothetical protein
VRAIRSRARRIALYSTENARHPPARSINAVNRLTCIDYCDAGIRRSDTSDRHAPLRFATSGPSLLLETAGLIVRAQRRLERETDAGVVRRLAIHDAEAITDFDFEILAANPSDCVRSVD